MFAFVEKNKRLLQVVLFLLFIPFAFFWVGDYFQDSGSGQTVARVGDYHITQDEFSRALRERQDAIQRAMEGRVDPAILDNPGLRQAVLESLIQQRLLADQALKTGVAVTDAQLRAAVAAQTYFQDGTGKFSFTQYEQYLRSEGMTPPQFEARLRRDLLLQQMSDGYADSAFVPRTTTAMLTRLAGQQREVSHFELKPEAFLPRVRLEADAARKYYDANPGEFRVPEQARVEYVVLSADTLMAGLQADPEEIRQYYEANRRKFGAEETRQAAHILIGVDAGAGPDAKQKARARAEEIYRALQKKPDGFAEAARRHSNDPGSAAKGGDLGTISRGSMKDTPEFERALYALKPGEISAPVETQYGYHIIRLTALQEARTKPLEEVRGQIEAELLKQRAMRRFAEVAETFNNTVFEQSDSLKPAAEVAKSAVQQSGWISRAGAEAPLDNPRLLAAIFSDEALKDRRNTEAVEVAPGTLVAARVIESKPASTRPFEEVRAALEASLARREAVRLAAEEGRQRLEALKQGKPVEAAWSAPHLVNRENPGDLPPAAARQVFLADASKLPAYAGADGPQGEYILLRITRVQDGADTEPEKARQFADQLRLVVAREALIAYVASLRQKAGVTIFKERIEKQQ